MTAGIRHVEIREVVAFAVYDLDVPQVRKNGPDVIDPARVPFRILALKIEGQPRGVSRVGPEFQRVAGAGRLPKQPPVGPVAQRPRLKELREPQRRREQGLIIGNI